jgi:hypothetical protein
MATYEILDNRPCTLCTECTEGAHHSAEGEVYHVIKDGGEDTNMCVDCLREKGLLW